MAGYSNSQQVCAKASIALAETDGVGDFSRLHPRLGTMHYFQWPLDDGDLTAINDGVAAVVFASTATTTATSCCCYCCLSRGA